MLLLRANPIGLAAGKSYHEGRGTKSFTGECTTISVFIFEFFSHGLSKMIDNNMYHVQFVFTISFPNLSIYTYSPTS